MKSRFTYRLFWLVLLMTACEDPSDHAMQTQLLNTLVVEAVLTNEVTNHRVRLTRPVRTPAEAPQAISGALVQITESAGPTVTLTEQPSGSGIYRTPLARAVFGKVYTLRIVHQGKEYLAQDSSQPVDALPSLGFEAAPSGNFAYRLREPAQGNSANYIEHAISWQNTPSCSTAGNCIGLLTYYDLKNLDVNAQFKPGQTEFTFPSGSTIIRRKYSASNAYKAFLRSMLSETEWRGGVFDVERGNTTTNLSNGAIGFFAVTTVVSDTTVVK